MTTAIVHISRGTPAAPRWCVLRSAIPGARITTLCAEAVDYQLLPIATSVPVQYLCPACRTERSAGTPGGAVAIDPGDETGAERSALEIAIGRAPTPNLRGPRAAPGAVDPAAGWDECDGAPGPDTAAIRGALDHLDDLREAR